MGVCGKYWSVRQIENEDIGFDIPNRLGTAFPGVGNAVPDRSGTSFPTVWESRRL